MKPTHAVIVEPCHSGVVTDTVISALDTPSAFPAGDDGVSELSVTFRTPIGKAKEYLKGVLGLAEDEIETV